MIYAYIDEQRGNVPVVRLCHALGVSTSGYYAGRQRGPSQRTRANEVLLVYLRAIRVETHETYGSPRMQAELVERGQPCSVNRVARLTGALHRMCAAVSPGGASQAALSSQDDLPGSHSAGGAQSAGPRLHGGCAESKVAGRHHVCSHR